MSSPRPRTSYARTGHGHRRIRTVAHVSTQPAGATETAYAVEQKQHLVKTLGRFDMIFFTVAVIVGPGPHRSGRVQRDRGDHLGGDPDGAVPAPYGLVMAEVGSAFTAEGGPYEWVKLTMGRFWAGLNTIFYWVTNPLWIGGSLAFIGDRGVVAGHLGHQLRRLLGLRVQVPVHLGVDLQRDHLLQGRQVDPDARGRSSRSRWSCVFARHRRHLRDRERLPGHRHRRPVAHGRGPARDRAAAALLVRRLRGPERRGRGDEGPAEGRPQSIMRSGALAAFCYLVPIFLVLLVLPGRRDHRLGGFLDAVKESYTIYGGARRRFMFGVTAILFIFTLMNSGASWMMCGDRVLAVAAADGSVLPVLRGVPPEARDAAAGEHALGRDGDGVHGRRRAPAVGRRGRRVRRRAEHRHLDDAHLLHPRLPERVPAARAGTRTCTGRSASARPARACCWRAWRSSRSGSRSARGRRCSPGRSTSCSA